MSRINITPRRLAVLLLVIGAAWQVPARAEIGIDLTVGRAVQRDGDALVGVGVNASWQPAPGWVWPEIGHEERLLPIFGGETSETTAGLRQEWRLGHGRVWLGGGMARVRMNSGGWGGDSGDVSGWYAHIGAAWPIGQGAFQMGVDGRIVRAADLVLPWGSVPVGSLRTGLVLGWRF